jgi:hypothetical protein
LPYNPVAAFPFLAKTKWREIERANDRYNCIAYALGITDRRWWPASRGYYWPPGAPTIPIRATFAGVFGQFGYEPCGDDKLEAGFEKIALYELMGMAKHAARQMSDGSWRSKLGLQQLIEHELAGLERASYGNVAAYFRREVRTA